MPYSSLCKCENCITNDFMEQIKGEGLLPTELLDRIIQETLDECYDLDDEIPIMPKDNKQNG